MEFPIEAMESDRFVPDDEGTELRFDLNESRS